MRKADAWVISGDVECRDGGWIDCMAWQDGEFSKPLYALSPDEFIVTREQLQTWARGDETGWIEKEIMALLTGDTGRG